VRVAGVMRENASALRKVRERANSVEFCEQAANRMSRKVDAGRGESTGEALQRSRTVKENDEGEINAATASFPIAQNVPLNPWRFQDGSKIPGEHRTRKNVRTAGGPGLRREFRLHMDRNATTRTLFELREDARWLPRAAARIEINDDEFRGGSSMLSSASLVVATLNSTPNCLAVSATFI